MPELFPSDADLNALSGTADAQQEVPYIPIGQSPYYTSFYQMLYRLLDVARRSGDLRVYKDGELTFGVRAGRWMNGDSEIVCAPSAANALTNNAANYIYLLADGTLTVSTAGFPTPNVTPHIRLAVITAAAGTYSHADIDDRRGASFISLLS
jgi:hypothetical protein